MLKRMFAALAVPLLVISPNLFNGVRADDHGWAPSQAEAAWTYNGYQVQRLALSKNTIGPMAFGDSVLVAEPTSNGFGTVTVLKDGLSKEIPNVPLRAVDYDRFVKNGNRFLFAVPTYDSNDGWTVREINLASGDLTTVIPSVFLSGASNVDVMVDNTGTYFFNHDIRYNGDVLNYVPRLVSVWNPAEHVAEAPFNRYASTPKHEVLMDVQDKVALVQVVQANGEKDLWLYGTEIVNHTKGFMKPVEGSWTTGGDIQYARFVAGGTVEYFQYFVRRTFTLGETQSVKKGETISWFRPITASARLEGETLAWLSPEDVVYVSGPTAVATSYGTAPGGVFAIENGNVFRNGSQVSLATAAVTALPLRVTDASGKVFAGVDESGSVLVRTADATLRVGFGTNPVLTSDRHAYWRGKDNRIYAATVTRMTPAARALRVAGNPTVSLVIGSNRWTISNESVFKSWFKSWSAVEVVSQAQLDRFPLVGTARFAPGALIKAEGETRVYAIAKDGTIRLVANAQTGYAVFGDTWYAKIVNVKAPDLIPYSVGAPLTTASDAIGLF